MINTLAVPSLVFAIGALIYVAVFLILVSKAELIMMPLHQYLRLTIFLLFLPCIFLLIESVSLLFKDLAPFIGVSVTIFAIGFILFFGSRNRKIYMLCWTITVALAVLLSRIIPIFSSGSSDIDFQIQNYKYLPLKGVPLTHQSDAQSIFPIRWSNSFFKGQKSVEQVTSNLIDLIERVILSERTIMLQNEKNVVVYKVLPSHEYPSQIDIFTRTEKFNIPITDVKNDDLKKLGVERSVHWRFSNQGECSQIDFKWRNEKATLPINTSFFPELGAIPTKETKLERIEVLHFPMDDGWEHMISKFDIISVKETPTQLDSKLVSLGVEISVHWRFFDQGEHKQIDFKWKDGAFALPIDTRFMPEQDAISTKETKLVRIEVLHLPIDDGSEHMISKFDIISAKEIPIQFDSEIEVQLESKIYFPILGYYSPDTDLDISDIFSPLSVQLFTDEAIQDYRSMKPHEFFEVTVSKFNDGNELIAKVERTRIRSEDDYHIPSADYGNILDVWWTWRDRVDGLPIKISSGEGDVYLDKKHLHSSIVSKIENLESGELARFNVIFDQRDKPKLFHVRRMDVFKLSSAESLTFPDTSWSIISDFRVTRILDLSDQILFYKSSGEMISIEKRLIKTEQLPEFERLSGSSIGDGVLSISAILDKPPTNDYEVRPFALSFKFFFSKYRIN